MPEELLLSARENVGQIFDYLYLVISKTWFVWVPIFLYLAYRIWLFRKQIKWSQSIKYELVAISIPADSVKDPKSMEQIFTGLHSVEKSRNFFETNFFGELQLGFSFEIVGINGHVRFIIRTPDFYRNAVESLVYAYYPDAEIMEVEDYVAFAPKIYPDDKYSMYGTEVVLTKPDAYPIRTYLSFAEDIEQGFIDPVAALTESMSSLSPGEQLWFQILIRPRWDDKWKQGVLAEVDKLMKRPVAPYTDWFRKYVISGWHSVESNVDQSLGFPAAEIDEDGGPEMNFMSPGEREIIGAIESSMAKIAFQVKMRFVYIANNDVFDKPKGVLPMFVYMRIFTTENLNGLKPNTKNWTSVDYFKKLRLPWRQRKIMSAYTSRDLDAGANGYVMSTEELATLYHFPYESVKAPTLERTDAKKSEPPADLPLA
ncbi:hypothetical protein KKC60_05585 [Patescibacteria group bacterium]|nr:hypothetical protein [Patescibacteria group bacterium]